MTDETDNSQPPDSPARLATDHTDAPRAPDASDTTLPAPPLDSPANDDETPEQKRARIIAEAKAKAAAKAAATGDAQTTGSSTSPVASDEEKAARIAAARAKAAALKQTAGAIGTTPTATTPTTPSAAATPTATGAAGVPKPPVKKKDEGPKPTDAANHPLVKRLREQLDGAVLEASEFLGQLSVRIHPARIVAVCEFLRSDAESAFDYLSDLTCVHYPDNAAAPFEVVYQLYSISANTRVRLKAATSEAEGIESVTNIWPTGNWLEREVYDLFGVRFVNHPDLRRLLLPPDWEGHPLRKDYPLEPVENNWTRKHLPEFTDVQREQLEQRRAYGLEALSTPDERRVRELFIAGKEVMPLDRK